MRTRPKLFPVFLVLASGGPWILCLRASEKAPPRGVPRLLWGAFPQKGPTEGLEEEVLDFRYKPGRWQGCVGLPDDLHKSIVGSDGGLYYDWGSGPYRGFRTMIRLGVAGAGARHSSAQKLLSPQVPIVITDESFDSLTVHQEAWARAPQRSVLSERHTYREDLLWVTARAQVGSQAKLVLRVRTPASLVANSSGTALVYRSDGSRAFLWVDPPCREIKGLGAAGPLRLQSAASVQRNWAAPRIRCHSRFRHVIVGWNGPIRFACSVKPGGTYRIVFGLIEGWHTKGGMRPLKLSIEGKVLREVDLIAERGRNVPCLFTFTASDRNQDGKLSCAVLPCEGAPDQNTILSALWVFAAGSSPTETDLLSGEADRDAVAWADADSAQTGTAADLLFPLSSQGEAAQVDVLVTVPRGEKAQRRVRTSGVPLMQAHAERQRACEYWRAVALPYDRIVVPDETVQDLLDSCIRNLYQAREERNGRLVFQVGPTCYRGTWAADGPFIIEAITYLGREEEARESLEAQVDRDDGPGGMAFSKKSGLRLWMIYRHAQLTGDRVWLERMWGRIVREVKQIQAYRAFTRTDPFQANYGLMPIGFGDGGLGGKHREYTNVYWTLAGLHAAVEAAQWLGRAEAQAWHDEYQDYFAAFDRARRRDTQVDPHGIRYVPVTMQGEQKQPPQRGAWAFLHSVFPGRIYDPADPFMLGTMAMLTSNEREGLIYGTGWLAHGIWNYAGSFYAHAHLYLGHGKKAARTMYAFANHACPLLCFREEQNCVGAPYRECGDMPHNWASAEFIRLVRHLLILERSGQLHLFEGIPSSWTRGGCTTALTSVPTTFGPVSVELKVAPGERGAHLSLCLEKEKPHRALFRPQLEAFVLHLENFAWKVKEVRYRSVPGPHKARFEVELAAGK